MVPIRRFLARYVSAVILLACLICVLHQYLVGNPNFYQLDAYTGESEAFRSLSFGTAVLELWEFAGKEGLDPYDVLAVYMITNGYSLEGTDLYLSLSTYKENYESLTAVKPVEFKKLRNAYETVPVSYTHLDVYKRQANPSAGIKISRWNYTTPVKIVNVIGD